MFVNSNFKIFEPNYFYREYENDIGKGDPKSKSLKDQCKQITNATLPVIALYQSINQPLALTLGAARTISSLVQLFESINNGDRAFIGYALFQTIIAVSSFAGTIFAHPIGMLINTGHDLLINATHLIQALQNGDYQKALEISAQILNNTLYLGLFFTGAQEILIASLGVQALLGFYKSSEDFQKGNYLEAASQFLMASIRTGQLNTQVNVLKLKWAVQAHILEVQRDFENKPNYQESNYEIVNNESCLTLVPDDNLIKTTRIELKKINNM